ncbi:Piso0_004897 [Millerozyma farinosa CBS 7064]|uniref:Piso0_004897 protein n=1 Tax=Pichia sorbitophila (strain ATCC MYA-4447 / BCRC 22081 / CBS 7064 / NBRC 10061 / NRRL Y-12695) TaxID=559304 RepID=G8Y0Q7_PICSO|nr:Piso0_004897 [Millerozyma farinosa CBS 7064]
MSDRNELFVDEEENLDSGMVSDDTGSFHEANEELLDDDPIVESISLVMNQVPHPSTQSLHLIQYVGKPKTTSLDDQNISGSIKEESNYLELNVPLDTSRFYDETRAEEWEAQVTENSLRGVFDKTSGGLYAAHFVISNGTKKMVLVPIDSTTQIRSSFKYLDEIDMKKNSSTVNWMEPTKQSKMHILQTSGKNAQSNTSDGSTSHALGDTLKHVKKFEEEDWSALRIVEPNHADSEQVRREIANNADDLILETETRMDEYLDTLINT